MIIAKSRPKWNFLNTDHDESFARQSQMTPPRDCDITEPSLREDVSRIE
jgi:hypothetical protein